MSVFWVFPVGTFPGARFAKTLLSAESCRYSSRPTSPFQILYWTVAVTSYNSTREPGATASVRIPSESWKYSSRIVGAGSRVELYEVTATLQYKIWKGLVGRLEYRHDSADNKVFANRAPGNVPTGKTQDTLTLALYYSFF